MPDIFDQAVAIQAKSPKEDIFDRAAREQPRVSSLIPSPADVDQHVTQAAQQAVA